MEDAGRQRGFVAIVAVDEGLGVMAVSACSGCSGRPVGGP